MSTHVNGISPMHEINLGNPLQIREQIAARIERGEEIVDAAKREERDFTDSEHAEFDGLMDEVGSEPKQTGLRGSLEKAEARENARLAKLTPACRQRYGTGAEFLDVSTGLPVRALSNSQRVSNADEISPGRVVASMLLNDADIMNSNEREIFAQQDGKLVPNTVRRGTREPDLSTQPLRGIAIESPGEGQDVMLGMFRDDQGGRYFMVTNLWHDADTKADDRALSVTLRLGPEVRELHRLNRLTGEVEQLPIREGSVQIHLPGGTGDLFKVDDGKFPGLTESR